jgi:hypothetical protein
MLRKLRIEDMVIIREQSARTDKHGKASGTTAESCSRGDREQNVFPS